MSFSISYTKDVVQVGIGGHLDLNFFLNFKFSSILVCVTCILRLTAEYMEVFVILPRLCTDFVDGLQTVRLRNCLPSWLHGSGFYHVGTLTRRRRHSSLGTPRLNRLSENAITTFNVYYILIKL